MSDAPERIWGLFDQYGHGSTMLREISQSQSPLFHGPKPTEYIRVDLAEAKLAKAVNGFKDVIGMLDDPHGGEHVRDMRGATLIARKALAELKGEENE